MSNISANEIDEVINTIVEKNNKSQCIKSFFNSVLKNKFNSSHFAEFAINGKLEIFNSRPHIWKVLLGNINIDISESILVTWNNRKEYKKKNKFYNSKKSFAGDPLSKGGIVLDKKIEKTNSNNSFNEKGQGWNEFYQDKETKKIIQLDLNRTYQNMNLFHDEKIKENLSTILYIWAKENATISYKQGMNEIVAVLFVCFYPYYFKSEKDSFLKEALKTYNKQLTDNTNNINREEYNKNLIDRLYLDINSVLDFLNTNYNEDTIIESEESKEFKVLNDFYTFFHDEEEIYADIYCLFDIIMSRGIKDLYDTSLLSQSNSNSYFNNKKEDLFKLVWENKNDTINTTPKEDQIPLQRKCNEIISCKLKILDFDLYQYFNFIEIECSIFLQRWLKCMFNREFDYKQIMLIWDSIFANDFVENIEMVSENCYNNLNMIDYICIAMLVSIKSESKSIFKFSNVYG